MRQSSDSMVGGPSFGLMLQTYARKILGEQGWLAMPLTYDGAGFAKKPIVPGWTTLEPTFEVIDSLPWQFAKGLGIILGAKSNNLGVLDIDDEGLTEALIPMFKGTKPPRVIRTARNRCHVYCTEPAPSASTRFTVQWDGRPCTIEYKSTGTQVAAPPTPGYSVQLDGFLPKITLDALWIGLGRYLAANYPDKYTASPANTPTTANYPKPWNPHVPKEQRNNTLYVEAHRLREAGVPLDEAMAYLGHRVGNAYDTGDFGLNEVQRTVRSAYSKEPRGLAHAGERVSELELLG